MRDEKFVVGKEYEAYETGIPTENIFSNEDGQYTIDDLIRMLFIAKSRWGNLPISISDVGFDESHHGETIQISQLYLYKEKNGNKFCVIESTP